jgi:hypothetical protein
MELNFSGKDSLVEENNSKESIKSIDSLVVEDYLDMNMLKQPLSIIN